MSHDHLNHVLVLLLRLPPHRHELLHHVGPVIGQFEKGAIISYSPATGGGDNKPSLPKGAFAQQLLLRVLSYIAVARGHSGIIDTHE